MSLFDGNLMNAFISMMGLVSILALALFYLKKASKKYSIRNTGGIKIIERTPISPKSQLIIVEIAGKFLLLGVTEQNINVIKELEYNNSDNEKFKFKKTNSLTSANETNINTIEDVSFKTFLKATFQKQKSN